MTDSSDFTKHASDWLRKRVVTYGPQALRGLSECEKLSASRKYQAEKFEAGYAGIDWPKKYCGQGLTAIERLAFDHEENRLGLPNDFFVVSLGQPVPIMLRYLPDGWKQERARAALRGDEIWCQLFSEPSGGSDLAGLRTRAERDGDDWVVTGQKLWTTWAQYSDFGVIIARTDSSVPKHQGLTYFWVNMRSRGIEVRPIRLAGGTYDINEVFFDEVRIPDSQRLGKIGGGFGVALETLVAERYTAADPASYGPPIEHFLELARRTKIGGRAAIEDDRVRERIADLYALQQALVSIHKRSLMALQRGEEPGPEGAVHKLISARARQRISEFAIDIMGPEGLVYDSYASARENWTVSWLTAPVVRIAGGADEMLLNTIGERILGLPQDHRPDKGVPFNEIPR